MGGATCAPVKVFLWVPYGGMRPWVPGQRGRWRMVPRRLEHPRRQPSGLSRAHRQSSPDALLVRPMSAMAQCLLSVTGRQMCARRRLPRSGYALRRGWLSERPSTRTWRHHATLILRALLSVQLVSDRIGGAGSLRHPTAAIRVPPLSFALVSGRHQARAGRTARGDVQYWLLRLNLRPIDHYQGVRRKRKRCAAHRDRQQQ